MLPACAPLIRRLVLSKGKLVLSGASPCRFRLHFSSHYYCACTAANHVHLILHLQYYYKRPSAMGARRCKTVFGDGPTSAILEEIEAFRRSAAFAKAQRKPLLSASELPGIASTTILEGVAAVDTSRIVQLKAVFGVLGMSTVIFMVFTALLRLMSATMGLWVLITAFIGAEIAFLICFLPWHAYNLNKQPVPHMPSHQDPILAFKRLVAHAKFYEEHCCRPIDWRSYISKWFKGTAAENVKYDNLCEMLAYGFFYTTKEALQADGRWHWVKEMARQLTQLATPERTQEPLSGTCNDHLDSRINLQDGYQPGLEFMAHLWEPLPWHYRPLCFYVATELLHCITWSAMTAIGMRAIRVNGMTVYYNQGNNTQPANSKAGPSTTTPLLFIHGVGLGLIPYLFIICRLVASGHPVITPEFRHVSMRLCQKVPTAGQVADNIVAALDRLGRRQVCVISHSFGTFVASRLIQAHPQYVHSLALIDPVCFSMFLPGLLANFVYRTLWDMYRKGGWLKVLKTLPVYFVSKDIHIAATFCRGFYWTDVNLWPDDLPDKSLVVLAGEDELLHADEIRQVVTGAYQGIPKGPQPMTLDDLLVSEPLCGNNIIAEELTQKPAHGQARVLWHPTAGHADWLLDSAWQKEIVQQLLSLARPESPQQQVARRPTMYITALSSSGTTLKSDNPVQRIQSGQAATPSCIRIEKIAEAPAEAKDHMDHKLDSVRRARTVQACMSCTMVDNKSSHWHMLPAVSQCGQDMEAIASDLKGLIHGRGVPPTEQRVHSS